MVTAAAPAGRALGAGARRLQQATVGLAGDLATCRQSLASAQGQLALAQAGQRTAQVTLATASLAAVSVARTAVSPGVPCGQMSVHCA